MGYNVNPRTGRLVPYPPRRTGRPVDLTPLGPCLHGFPLEQGEIAGMGVFNDLVGDVLTWSIPVIETCPGSTPFCRRECYAKRMQRRRPRMGKGWAENYWRSFRGDFPDDLIREALWRYQRSQRTPWRNQDRRRGVPKEQWSQYPNLQPKPLLKAVRIHVSGDFYSPEYVAKWAEIARRLPDWRFWTYTRCWRLPQFRNALRELRSLPNVVVYASTDPDTGSPPSEWLEAGFEGHMHRRGRMCTYDVQERRGIPRPNRVFCRNCGYCISGRGSVAWAWG